MLKNTTHYINGIMSKINTTVTMGLVISVILGIFIGYAICTITPAFGETTVIYELGDNPIMIVDDGFSNIVIFEDKKYYDLRVKNYNSGGFYMKNSEILVFAHPVDIQYRLTVFSHGEVYRIMADVGVLSDFITTPKVTVGTDISKWDIPTEGRNQHAPYVKPEKVHDPDSLDIINSVPNRVEWKNDLIFDFTLIDTQIINTNDQRLDNVDVQITITNPIGEIVGTWNGTTGNFGTFGDRYHIADNQMVGEYTLNVHAEKEKYNPISKMVSFFVIPLDDGSSRKCPAGFDMNSTGFCEEDS